MAQSCIQEQFTCARCGAELIRVDFTAPVPSNVLRAVWDRVIEPIREAFSGPCDRCTQSVQPEE